MSLMIMFLVVFFMPVLLMAVKVVGYGIGAVLALIVLVVKAAATWAFKKGVALARRRAPSA